MIKMILANSGARLEISPEKFNGGEYNLKLPRELQELLLLPNENLGAIVLIPQLDSHDSFFELALCMGAIREINLDVEVILALGYMPYGRQDRICNEGEAFGLKIYADLINSLNFYSVVLLDPHSDVTPALLNNCKVASQCDLIPSMPSLNAWIIDAEPVLISPDAGANKKTLELAKTLGMSSFVRADKTREVATGKITETIVYDNKDELINADCLIVDDICDGGFTFIKLAEQLKLKGANSVVLCVSHGIFSKGFKELFDNGIDKIYTTDSLDVTKVLDSKEYLDSGQLVVESWLLN